MRSCSTSGVVDRPDRLGIDRQRNIFVLSVIVAGVGPSLRQLGSSVAHQVNCVAAGIYRRFP